MRAGAELSDADKATLARLEQGRGEAQQRRSTNRLLAGDQGRRRGRRRQARARRPQRRGHRRRRGRREGSAVDRQMGADAPEHDAAAGAVVAREPRAAPAAVRGLGPQRAEHGDANDTRRDHRCAWPSSAPSGRSSWASRPSPPTRSTTRWPKTPEKAIKLMTDLVPAATAKARGEAARMQTLIDRQQGRLPAQPWDWQFYAEQVRKAEYDARRIRRSSRTSSSTACCRTACSSPPTSSTASRSRSARTSRSISRTCACSRCSTPTASRSALFYGDYFKRDEQERRRLGRHASSTSAGLLGTQAVVFNVAQLHQARPGPAGAADLRRRDDDVPRVRPRAARLFVQRASTRGSRAPTAARLRRVPVAVQRALGAGPDGVRALRQALPDRRADARRRWWTRSSRRRTFDQGYATTEYLAAALLDMAWHTLPAGRAARRTSTPSRPAALKRFHVDLPQVPPRYHTTLLLAHLGQRLLRPATTPTSGAKCSTTTPTTGSRSTAA